MEIPKLNVLGLSTDIIDAMKAAVQRRAGLALVFLDHRQEPQRLRRCAHQGMGRRDGRDARTDGAFPLVAEPSTNRRADLALHEQVRFPQEQLAESFEKRLVDPRSGKKVGSLRFALEVSRQNTEPPLGEIDADLETRVDGALDPMPSPSRALATCRITGVVSSHTQLTVISRGLYWSSVSRE